MKDATDPTGPDSNWEEHRGLPWPTPGPAPRRLNPYPELLDSTTDMSFFRQEVPGGWLYTVVVKGEHPALTTTFVKEGP